MYDIFVFGSAYIVGGYLRDFLNSIASRDIDIIVDLDNEKLLEIIQNSEVEYTINRHKGIKLHFPNITVDMWSIENNWAFKNELVKLNDKDKLQSIAKGCFYNYDSLVVNLHSFNMNIQYYLNFKAEKKLEILQKSPLYKILNPTTEANILRAFYLKKIYHIDFSSNTKKYLIDKIGEITDKRLNPLLQLELTKASYKKYTSSLSESEIESSILELYKENNFDKQIYLKL
ncbi:Poly A polymerase head domain-containing protein [Leeuwenhoekiella marinoflava DSM 3653]|uniref:Poly(A) polymerase-like protein n=3 Tax=Leeuwenhoekiella marinoflava TaxID=988 RepID=A0A4Q0PLH7_9FLAO|nr:poly(A) polymerase-like protein [Leeuwenhoekiella marinoflava]SHF26542.1 Poly A polymerase head domain-containing protein [Leeuwenhoekiella marinoflava DSM 3653]